MYQRSGTGSFTIYGVMDPTTHRYVYVGQTADYEERKRSLLRKGDGTGPAPSPQGIRGWIHEAAGRGVVPVLVVLETASTWRESLRAEAAWVHRLAREHHPLLNRWHSQEPARDDAESQAIAGMRSPLEARQVSERDVTEGGLAQGSDQSPLPGPCAKPSPNKPANHGRPWTTALQDELSRSLNAGIPVTYIASALARTEMSIVLKLIQLGLLAEYPSHEPTAPISPVQREGIAEKKCHSHQKPTQARSGR